MLLDARKLPQIDVSGFGPTKEGGLPVILKDLFRVDVAKADAVDLFLAKYDNNQPQRERCPHLPDAASCGVLNEEYSVLLNREARNPGYLGVERLGELLTETEMAIEHALRQAAAKRRRPADVPWYETYRYLDYGGLPAEYAAVEAMELPARRIEAGLIVLAHQELKPIWTRLLRAEGPGENFDDAMARLFEDGELLYRRAHPRRNFAATRDDETVWSELIEQSDRGLALCYWLSLAYYKAAMARDFPPPGRRCLYCKRLLPAERTWRDDIRTCGDPGCERQYQSDRNWFIRHADEVFPVVAQRLSLAPGVDIHPGRVRLVWKELGLKTTRRSRQ